jgi:VanZ family protein
VEWILARGSLVRKWCLLYWFALTILLVVRDPTRWLRKEMHLGSAVSILEPVVHFVCFALLAALCMLSSWPVRRRWLLAVVACYAVATEAIQFLVPWRTPEWRDVLQNFAGMVCGAALAWGYYQVRAHWLKRQRPTAG